MKRIIVSILLFLMALGLVSCNNKKDVPAEEKSEANDNVIECKLGEISNESGIEFTLHSVEFADHLYPYTNTEDFLLPTDKVIKSSIYNEAEEGKKFVSVSFSIKNTCKTQLWAQGLHWSWDIVYDDGFTFTQSFVDDENSYVLKDGTWTGTNCEYGTYIDPLTSRDYRGCIQVPIEVFENKDEGLSFIMHISIPTDTKEGSNGSIGGVYYKNYEILYKMR